jgi:FkbM family methyltransferase
MSKYRYYLGSILTLVGGFKKPWQVVGLFLGLTRALPAEVVLRRSGWRFSVRSAMDVWIIKETCIDNDYMSGSDFNPAWTVVDIGAGLGDFTVLAAKACPEGLVHAYEPLSQSYRLLVHNLAINHIDWVICFEEVAGRAGQRLRPADHAKEAVSTSFVERGGASSVPAVDLSEILDRLPDSECDLMKIDCEGCEFELLLNAGRDQLSRIRRITIEAHDGYFGHSTTELISHLEKNGFLVRREPNPVHSYLSILYAER